jgi:hypothetical protein
VQAAQKGQTEKCVQSGAESIPGGETTSRLLAPRTPVIGGNKHRRESSTNNCQAYSLLAHWMPWIKQTERKTVTGRNTVYSLLEDACDLLISMSLTDEHGKYFPIGRL